jgi:hypothetical protein
LENSEQENSGFDFVEMDMFCPKPEHVLEFMEHWRGCLKGMTEKDFYQAKTERITGEFYD